MTTITLTLDPFTADWLNRESATSNLAPTDFVAELLRELADPDRVEEQLIDRLLAQSTDAFHGVMELDEQEELRGEVLDWLCHRLVVAHQEMLGEPMTEEEQTAFRARLEDRSQVIWG